MSKWVIAVALAAGAFVSGWSQGSVFTYQGRLEEAGAPVNNSALPVSFQLFDAAVGGSAVGAPLAGTVNVQNGHFTVQLDFSAVPTAFNGQRRWLQVTINGIPLTPRTEILPAPMATFAFNVADNAVSAPKLTIDFNSLNRVSGGSMFAIDGGNIGIGVASPAQRLHIGSISAFGTGILLTNNDTGGRTWQIHSTGSGNSTGAGHFLLSDQSGGGIRFVITPSGNVGIGVNNPTARLDVGGSVRMTGFQLGAGATAGHVLVTNAAGVGSWQPLSLNGIAAGGDLAGSYPNPTLAPLAVSTGEIANNAVTDQKIVSVSWNKVSGAPSSFPPNGFAGGDLEGQYPGPSIRSGAVTAEKLNPSVGVVPSGFFIASTSTASRNGYRYTGLSLPLNNSGNTWTPKAPMPRTRKEGGAATIHNVIYVVGGLDTNNNSLNQLDAYDPVSNTWSSRAPIPLAARRPGVVAYQNRLFVIGNNGNSRRVQVYYPNFDSWTDGPELPVAGPVLGAVALLDGIAVLLPGNPGGFRRIYRTDPDVTVWYPEDQNVPTVNQAGFTYLNGDFYLIGGAPISDTTASNQVLRLRGGAWAEVAKLPARMGEARIVTLGNRIYTLGGISNNQAPILTPFRYDPEADTWTTLAAMGADRRDFAAAASLNRIYLFGNDTASAGNLTSEYSPDITVYLFEKE